jgi:two-component system secretion response regulator SsrB
MSIQSSGTVVLADRHYGVAEGVRGLLGTVFDVVVTVADEASLGESALRLGPTLAVVELTLTPGESLAWLTRLRSRCPGLKVIVLSVHDEPSVREATLAAGAEGFVVKRAISTDLLPAVEAVLAGGRYPAGGSR